MENQERTQQTNESNNSLYGCFEPSSTIGKMMTKIMKKMCGSQDNEQFDCESIMSEMNCCSESK